MVEAAGVVADEVEAARVPRVDPAAAAGRDGVSGHPLHDRRADDRGEAGERAAGPELAAHRRDVGDDGGVDEVERARRQQPAALPLGVVAGHGGVDEHHVAARPQPTARVGDGEVARDRRVHHEHVVLARDGAAPVVGAVADQGRAVDRHVPVEGEDGPTRPVRGAAVDVGADHRHVAVLVGVEGTAVAVGGVAVDLRAHDEDVAGRPDGAAGPVDQVVAEDRVVDLDTPAARVEPAAVVVGQVAGDPGAVDGDPPHGEDPAARLLGQVLEHHDASQHHLAARRQRGAGAVRPAAGEGDPPDVEVAGAVLAQQPLLEAGLLQHVVVAVEHQRVRRLADRVADPAVAQQDVGAQVDAPAQGVGPGGAELLLGPHHVLPDGRLRHRRGRRLRWSRRTRCQHGRDPRRVVRPARQSARAGHDRRHEDQGGRHEGATWRAVVHHLVLPWPSVLPA